MSTSIYCDGLIPPDDEWRKMKAIYDSCEAAGISPPRQVHDYFGGDAPDPSVKIVSLSKIMREYSSENYGGYEIDLEKLPKGVKTIRVKWG